MTSLTRRLAPGGLGAAGVVVGGLVGLASAHRAHHLGSFELLVVGMAAGIVVVAGALLLEPSVVITFGLMLSVFSGNWSHLGIPLPLDRIVLVVGLLMALIRGRHEFAYGPGRVRALHWLMLLLLLYAIASAGWAGTLLQRQPLFALVDRLGLVPFLLYFVAPVAFRTERDRLNLARGLLILGAYLGLVSLFETVHLNALVLPKYILNPSLGITAGRARGPLLESGANGLAMLQCLVAAAISLRSWRSSAMRLVVIGVIALCAAGILFTLTRQIWVGAGVGAALAMASNRRLRLLLPFAAAGTAIVVALALAFVPSLSHSASQRVNQKTSVWDRLNSDAAALRMTEARPALGFGWGTFPTASPPYYRLARTYPLTQVAEVHNMPLSNAAELGLLGAILWAVIVLWALFRPMLVKVTGDHEPWRLGLIAVTVAWLIQANLAPLDYALDNYVVWLFGGIVMSGAIRRRAADVNAPGTTVDQLPPASERASSREVRSLA